MAEAEPLKLPLLAKRKRLPTLPSQPVGTSYGIVWNACTQPAECSCYLVKFITASSVEIIAYIDIAGRVFATDHPLALSPARVPDLQIVREHEEASIGTIRIAETDGERMRDVGSYLGRTDGLMSEVLTEDHPSEHPLTQGVRYREFMALTYLRHCVLVSDDDDDTAGAPDSELRPSGASNDSPAGAAIPDIPSQALSSAGLLDLFANLSLPDALTTLLFRLQETEHPTPLDRYALRLLQEIDIHRLEILVAAHHVTLAHISRTNSLYLSFNHADMDPKDIYALYAVESVLNRLDKLIASSESDRTPITSEADYALLDSLLFSSVTADVPHVLDQLTARNHWAAPGTRTCKPGGEWDTRTRFATIMEGIFLVTHLDYSFLCDAASGVMGVRISAPQPAEMPRSYPAADETTWVDYSSDERARCAREYASRLAIIAAAACFATGEHIDRCYITMHDLAYPVRDITYRFYRDMFWSTYTGLAHELEDTPLTTSLGFDRLDSAIAPAGMPPIGSSQRFNAPRHDDRPLPDALKPLLLADTVSELEVMEPADSPSMAQLTAIRKQAVLDPRGALHQLEALVSSLTADCAVAELEAAEPVITQFCENHLARMLLTLCESDERTRVLRAPDALYFAQYELASIYLRMGDPDRALEEARHALDMASTSSQAHFLMISVLSRLERFDEVVEVAKHGMRSAYDREAISYYYYRLAFAYWRLGQREVARACYALVPRGERISDTAREELRELEGHMGVSGELSVPDAMDAVRAAGVPVPPTVELSNLVADLAVLLVDNGFFFLAARCVYHLWRTAGRDELNIVCESLQD